VTAKEKLIFLKKTIDNLLILGYICYVMKRISLILAIIFLVGTAFSGAYFNIFTARSESDNIVLSWETGDENNIEYFGIERKTPNSTFILIDKVNPKGDNSSYTYTDKNIYKTNEDLYIYRIAIHEHNSSNVTYSAEVSVSHYLSNVKRTWGSIKAMFR